MTRLVRRFDPWWILWALVFGYCAVPHRVHAQLAVTTSQGAAVAPIAPGAVQLTLHYTAANGLPATLVVPLLVTPAPIALIRPINALNPARWVDSAVAGTKKWCPLAWATDSAGHTLSGRPIGWSTNDSTIAAATANPACPDTSIDPAKMTTLPQPPSLLSLLNLTPER